MSNQKSFTPKLDAWIDSNVLEQQEWDADEEASQEELEETWERIKRTIRRKVRSKILRAYEKGVKAGIASISQGPKMPRKKKASRRTLDF
jgi:ribosome modulation factor